MHLNEMKTMDDMLAVLCDLVEPMAEISRDPEISRLMVECLEAVSKAETSISRFVVFMPLQCALLKNHRAQTLQMIAATTGRTVKEIEERKLADQLADVRNLITKDFLVFFR